MPKKVISISVDEGSIPKVKQAATRAGKSRSEWYDYVSSILVPFDTLLFARFILTQYGERTAQELVAELVRQMEKK